MTGSAGGWMVGFVGLCLATAASGAESDMASISATVVETKLDGSSRVIAEPKLVVPIGKWAAFREGGEEVLPSEYTLPNIPEELAGSAKMEDGESGKPKWETNRKGVVIPSHPKSFETHFHGLTMKFRPRLGNLGKLVVDCEMEKKSFEGFVNYGRAITVVKKKAGGAEKREILSRNAIQLPVFHTRSQEMVFLPTESGHVSKMLSEVVEPKEKTGKAARIEVTLKVKRLEKLKSSPKKAPKDPYVYVTVKAIEIAEEMGHAFEIPESLSSEFSILTDSQFQAMIRALAQKKGVDLLSAPSIMLRPGQSGQVEVLKDFIYPEAYDPPEISGEEEIADDPGKDGFSFPVTPAAPTEFATTETGVSIGVLARVLSDGRIELELEPGVTEFVELRNFGQPIVYLDKNAFGKTREIVMSENRMEVPSFQKRSLKTTVRMPDNATVVLGGMIREDIQDVEDKVPVLGDLPLIGGLGRSKVELHLKRHLYFAVKAQLVDPADQ